jgi:hypothetical protein
LTPCEHLKKMASCRDAADGETGVPEICTYRLSETSRFSVIKTFSLDSSIAYSYHHFYFYRHK